MLRASSLAILAGLLCASSLVAAPPTLPEEALALPGAGRPAGRNAVPSDPVLLSIVKGEWKSPKAGDTVPNPAGPARTWTAVPIKKGVIAAPGVPSYAYVPVKSEAQRVAVLHARGHSMVYVNGEPRTGDVYGTGYVRLPILLREGVNDLLFVGGRGQIAVEFLEPKATAELDTADVTAPDFRVGTAIDTHAALLVRNNTNETASGLMLESTAPGGMPVRTPVPPLPPLSVRKVGFRVVGPAPTIVAPVRLPVRLVKGDAQLDTTWFETRAVPPEATHKRTFVSDIDGSVQYYSLVPAKPGEGGKKPGLVLTLHGASVEAQGQAACYAPKPGLHVVAATNRRPFGFDWEDWGRLDAMEVLDLTSRELDADPRRTFLTGHSMGGHGTWHLGVTFPGRFAAIAPSAGWVSMWSYAGMKADPNATPERELVLRASNPSDTLALVKNLTPTGVYVLHGDADDNVPVSQARTMRRELAGFHSDFTYYERPGAGHWWGNACVDWPPIFEFFARRELPEPGNVRGVTFRTANPRVSAECRWLTIAAQTRPLLFSGADLKHDPAKRAFSGDTENVAVLSLDLAHLKAGEPVSVALDGDELEAVQWPAEGTHLWFARTGGTWKQVPKPPLAQKGPHRAGPFNDGFRNRMIFVYGTQGTPDENAWALAKARFDAETFWYRGNGSIDVVPDSAFDPKADPDRNVVLYGHAKLNAAWGPLLGESPVQAPGGAIRVGDRSEMGTGRGLLLIRPRPGSDRATVAAIAGTDATGLRLTDRLPIFSSGVGYPDWLVLDSSGVQGAGYFANDWTLNAEESAWRAK